MPRLDPYVTPRLAPRRLGSIGMAVLAGVLLLSGCGTIKLHSETRQKQGEAAAKAWGEVNLAAYFDTERANQAKLLAEEIESTRRLAAVNRETEIRVLARMKVSDLSGHYDAALSEAVLGASIAIDPATWGTVEPGLLEAKNQRITEQATRRDFERASSFLQSMGVPRFGCDQLIAADPKALNDWKNANPALARRVGNRLGKAIELCNAADTAQASYIAALNSVPEGTLKNRVREWESARKQMRDRETSLDNARAEYNKALKAYLDEVELAKAGKSTVEAVKKLAASAAEALVVLERVQGFLGTEVASEERIKRINDLLSSLKAGTALDTEDASKAALVASMLPLLADDLRAIGQAKKGRALVPLLIQRDIEQANLNAAAVQVAIQRKDLVLREAIVEAAMDQAVTYIRARRLVAELMGCKEVAIIGNLEKCKLVDKTKSVHAIWNDLEPIARRVLLESTMLYVDGFSRQQVKLDTMTTQYLALPREQTVELSEVHASMWAALIGASVTQAAEFAALGIKVEQIEKILNLLGIFYIGYGVNN